MCVSINLNASFTAACPERDQIVVDDLERHAQPRRILKVLSGEVRKYQALGPSYCHSSSLKTYMSLRLWAYASVAAQQQEACRKVTALIGK
jgi:hypothetical protein